MSNIYILSNELCDFCNVPHGTRMHIKQIVRKIEDYILNSMFDKEKGVPNRCFVWTRGGQHLHSAIIGQSNYKELNEYLDNKIKIMYLDDKLKEIFINVPADDYIIQTINQLAKRDGGTSYKRFTHNFDDIDMYLEMSGHLTPVLQQDINVYFNKVSSKIDNVKQEITDTLNKISNKIDNVKSLVSFSNDAENELIEVNKLLKELEEMYNSK